jgi:tetratricopeptide (TPR) repeat protein
VGGGSVFCIVFIALGAIAVLLRVPALPNCPAVFWPIASASVRLYCAELAASKKNLDDLLEAIALLEDLPPDHELRSQADQHLETWTQQVLELAEAVFQAGDLERAIATVKRIPAGVSSYGLVESTITQWREVWDRATELERTFREQMAERQWAAAAGTLAQLRRIDNRHWTTEKLAQFRVDLDQAQQDDGLLQRSRRVIAGGNVEAIKAAIEELQKIEPERAAYGEAQAEIEAATDRLIALARSRLQAGDADGVLAIAPPSVLPPKRQQASLEPRLGR